MSITFLVKLHIEKIQLLHALDVRSDDALSLCFESQFKMSTTQDFQIEPVVDSSIPVNQSLSFVCFADSKYVYKLILRRKQRKSRLGRFVVVALADVPMQSWATITNTGDVVYQSTHINLLDFSGKPCVQLSVIISAQLVEQDGSPFVTPGEGAMVLLESSKRSLLCAEYPKRCSASRLEGDKSLELADDTTDDDDREGEIEHSEPRGYALLRSLGEYSLGTNSATGSSTSLTKALGASIESNRILHAEVEHLRKQQLLMEGNTIELKRLESVATALQSSNATLTSQLADQADYLSTLVDYIKSSAVDSDGGGGSNPDAIIIPLKDKLDSVAEQLRSANALNKVLVQDLAQRPSVNRTLELTKENEALRERLGYAITLIASLTSDCSGEDNQMISAAIEHANGTAYHRAAEVALLMHQKNNYHRQLIALAHQLHIVTSGRETCGQANAFSGPDAWTPERLAAWKAENPIISLEVSAGLINPQLVDIKHDLSSATLRIAELEGIIEDLRAQIAARDGTLAQAKEFISYQNMQLQELQSTSQASGSTIDAASHALITSLQQDLLAAKNTAMLFKQQLDADSSAMYTRDLESRIVELEGQLTEAEEARDKYLEKLRLGAEYVQGLKDELAAAQAKDQDGTNSESFSALEVQVEELKSELLAKDNEILLLRAKSPVSENGEVSLDMEELRQELEDTLELNQKYLNKLKRGSEVVATLNARIAELEAVASKGSSIDKSEPDDQSEQFRRITQLEESLADAQELNEKLMERMKKGSEVLTAQNQKIQELEEALEAASQPNHRSSEEVVSSSEIESLRQELVDAQELNEKLMERMKKGSEVLAAQNQKIQELEEALETASQPNQRSSEEVVSSSEIESLRQELVDAQELNEKLMEKMRKGSEVLAAQNQKIQELEECLDHKNGSPEATDKSAIDEIEALRQELEESEVVKEKLIERMKLGSDMLRQLREEITDVKNSRDELESELQGKIEELSLMAEVVESKERQLIAAEQALVHTKEVLSSSQNSQASSQGNSSALAISSTTVTKLNSDVEAATRSRDVVQADLTAALDRINELTFELSRLREERAHEEELFESDMKKARLSADKEITSQKVKFDEEIKSLRSELDAALVVRSNTLALTAAAADATNAANQANAELAVSHAEQVKLEEEVKNLQFAIEREQASNSSLRAQLAAAQQDFTQTQASLTQLEEIFNQARVAHHENESTISGLRTEVLRLTEAVRNGETQQQLIARLTEEIEGLRKTSGHGDSGDLVKLSAQVRDYEMRMKQGSEMLHALRLELQSTIVDRDKFEEITIIQEQQLQQLASDFKSAQQKLSELVILQEKLEAANDLVKQKDSDVTHLETALSVFQAELGSLREKLAADRGCVASVDGPMFGEISGVEFIDYDDYDASSIGDNSFSRISSYPSTPQASPGFGPTTGQFDEMLKSPMINLNSIYPTASRAAGAPVSQSAFDLKVAAASNAPSTTLPVTSNQGDSVWLNSLDKAALVQRILILKAAVKAKDELILAAGLIDNDSRQHSLEKTPILSSRMVQSTLSPRAAAIENDDLSQKLHRQLQQALTRYSDLSFNANLRIATLKTELAALRSRYLAAITVQNIDEKIPVHHITPARRASATSPAAGSPHTDDVFDISELLASSPVSSTTSSRRVSSYAGKRQSMSGGSGRKQSVSSVQSPGPTESTVVKALLDSASAAAIETLRKELEVALRSVQHVDSIRREREAEAESLRLQLRDLSTQLVTATSSASNHDRETVQLVEQQRLQLETELNNVVGELVKSKLQIAELQSEIENNKAAVHYAKAQYKEVVRQMSSVQSELAGANGRIVELENKGKIFGAKMPSMTMSMPSFRK